MSQHTTPVRLPTALVERLERLAVTMYAQDPFWCQQARQPSLSKMAAAALGEGLDHMEKRYGVVDDHS